jgi:hypothetical protein
VAEIVEIWIHFLCHMREEYQIIKKMTIFPSPPSCPSEASKERRREKGESLPAGQAGVG